MQINYFIELLGGLALFLYGMEMMSSGLELVAGDKLRTVIEKMTSSFFKCRTYDNLSGGWYYNGGKYWYNYNRSISCT